MGKQRRARRFDAHSPISTSSMEAEAEYVRREVEDYAVLAPSDVETWRTERHANCANTWKHILLIVAALPERDRRVVQALVFRDLWYVLELYKTYLQPARQNLPASPSMPSEASIPSPFSDFLFEM